QTKPVDLLNQYLFITAQSLMARITRNDDKAYADACILAAERCFDWARRVNDKRTPGELGSAIQASLELFGATQKDVYKQYAIQQAAALGKLQATRRIVGQDTLGGYFFESIDSKVPYKNIWNGCLELISLCDLVTAFPGHPNAAAW